MLQKEKIMTFFLNAPILSNLAQILRYLHVAPDNKYGVFSDNLVYIDQ